ncbi:SDR family NAD(P)-dependent oxidoreductase [Actinoplanes sp. HUAS TT8]|uniref:SDR family NAD(P)-dependent oxidoreductase n=1 Tax=Actinoplanes sp. HUAS TT8 TaxID=3447453 RepID=UPI003F5258B7
MDLHLRDKRAIVTGASRGIGLAVAEALAAEGVRLALVARGAPALESAAERLRKDGADVVVLPADTTDDAAVRAMADAAVAALGGVDILVNAAAEPAVPGTPHDLARLVDQDLRDEIETKVLGYLRTARAVAPHMVAQRWGRIVNVSGLAARSSGSPFGSIRNVSVAALTKNLADELGPHGVNVTVVHPGLTVTERLPALAEARARADGSTPEQARLALASGVSIGRLVTAAEVADVIVFLASPRSVAVNGDAVAVGGGVKGPIHY